MTTDGDSLRESLNTIIGPPVDNETGAQIIAPEPVRELLACLDVLMSHLEHITGTNEEYQEHYEALSAYYLTLDDAAEDGPARDALEEEYDEQYWTLRSIYYPDSETIHTALWQTTELAMALLGDHLELIELFQEARKEAEGIVVPKQELILP